MKYYIEIDKTKLGEKQGWKTKGVFMKCNTAINKILLALFFVLAATQSHALTLSTTDADYFGYDNSNGGMLAEFYDSTKIDFTLQEPLYKAEVGDNENPATKEEGIFTTSYETVFDNTPLDPSDAVISYVGSDIISNLGAWLFVKDGNHEPAWYAFSLDGWNGVEQIILNDFWYNGTDMENIPGAISHVAIYGTPVPEPATMLLFGTGLIGLAGIRGKRFKK